MRFLLFSSLLLCLTAGFNCQTPPSMKTETPTVDFCEMVIHPEKYLGKPAIITAKIAPYDEGLYFLSENSETFHCTGFGVSFANKNPAQHADIERNMDLLHSEEYGFRGVIRVAGVLRKPVPNYFSRNTGYAFEIERFEANEPLVRTQGPTVEFCEMVKNPSKYFDKTIVVSGILMQATEGRYLSDPRCPLTHDQQIGVSGAEVTENQRQKNAVFEERLRSIEYGGQARVTIAGVLRDKSLHAFAWYQYRFDLVRFEDIAHVVVPYERKLDGGVTYRAPVYFDTDARNLALVEPIKVFEHYAWYIDWVNLKEFPQLKTAANSLQPKTVVFSVLSNEIKQMTVDRWNITIQCKIQRVE